MDMFVRVTRDIMTQMLYMHDAMPRQRQMEHLAEIKMFVYSFRICN